MNKALLITSTLILALVYPFIRNPSPCKYQTHFYYLIFHFFQTTLNFVLSSLLLVC